MPKNSKCLLCNDLFKDANNIRERVDNFFRAKNKKNYALFKWPVKKQVPRQHK